jgi:hypothetical protein
VVRFSTYGTNTIRKEEKPTIILHAKIGLYSRGAPGDRQPPGYFKGGAGQRLLAFRNGCASHVSVADNRGARWEVCGLAAGRSSTGSLKTRHPQPHSQKNKNAFDSREAERRAELKQEIAGLLERQPQQLFDLVFDLARLSSPNS